ncbi:threonine--tRNA ligase [Candidatus Dependentiae bacterium]|nr:threonine--tRNA ligase [Candidatus Dependentiae bacterium]
MSLKIYIENSDKNIEVEENSSAIMLLKILQPENKNRIVAIKINGILKDLSAKLNNNDKIELVSFDSDEGKSIFWHSSSHLMAQAVKRLYPNAKLAIGPSIDDGFYYDFELEDPFTPEKLADIEKEMKKIVKENYKIERIVKTRQETINLFNQNNDKYKNELVEGFSEEKEFSFYKQSEFEDLCRGPHLYSTGSIKHFKLLSVAGAYWRGDSKREMLQRIYGISFPTAEELSEFLHIREEAKKRDHRKLGKQLNLFDFFPEGPGFPFFKPNGMILWNIVVDYIKKKLRDADYKEIKTPLILIEDLWHRSGHWDNYKDNMYFTQIDDRTFAVKPMNCPGCLLIYKSELHSYKELPLKYAELGQVHRHELSGVLNGLFRVRTFTQDDAHVFCSQDQIEDEIIKIINFIKEVYSDFGFTEYKIGLSTRPAKSIGSDEIWNTSETALKNALEKINVEYKIKKGDGAFYGPKIDFQIQDSLKRMWQCGTIQLDFSMPERFDLEYIGKDNNKHRPVMIHRAILGSLERFIGMLIEHYAGALPLWLAPEQIRILPVSENYIDYSKQILTELQKHNFRSYIDERNESLGKKIRDAQIEKVPYSLILGQKEMENSSVNYRKYGSTEQINCSVNDFIKLLS